MNKDTWIVIVNPKAGSGKVEKDWSEISNYFSLCELSHEILFTKHKYHAVELTVQSVRQGYRNFVSVGGDGTISEIVDGFFIQKVVPVTDLCLSVIPAGTGNDWMRMYNVNSTYEDAVNLVKSGSHHTQDVGYFRLCDHKVILDRTMVNVAGLGYDADVCYYSNAIKQKGKITKQGKTIYIKAAIKALFKRKSKHYRITVDDKIFYEGQVFSCAFGIGKYSGGGMQQMPDAVVDDGLINITVIKKANILKILMNFSKLFSGKIYDTYPLVDHTMGKNIHVDVISKKGVIGDIYENLEIDGEVFLACNLDLECINKGLNVIY
ncbi:MAG: diacylglycerol kinase family protein [Bacteroidales bacterium]